MSRIQPITDREQLDVEGRVVFDRILASRGGILRPFEVLLHTPAMADRVAALGQIVRSESRLRDADRELITLATGRAQGCAFVWESHLEAARGAGLEPRTIAALEEGGTGLGAREAPLVSFVRELCETGSVSDETFRAAHDLLGTPAVVEMSLTIGYYTMLGYTMNAVEAC